MLNLIGGFEACTESWVFDDLSDYITSMTIGNTTTYISYLRAETNNGHLFEVGDPSAGTQQTQEFTRDSPLIGIKGYKDFSGLLQALGFYRYSCIQAAKDAIDYVDPEPVSEPEPV